MYAPETVAENLKHYLNEIPSNVKLVAVSKTVGSEIIEATYNTGHRIYGENKVQDLNQKHQILPKDIEWHFIGHLQTNKVKYIAPYVTLIHGVDSLKLLKTIDKEAKKNSRIIDCLLEMHIAEEDSKFGLSYDEASEILKTEEYQLLENVNVVGVMGMATYTDDNEQIKNEFSSLKNTFDKLKVEFFSNNEKFCELSMGMSGDYKLAIEAGSTMVRIGSSIFGPRSY